MWEAKDDEPQVSRYDNIPEFIVKSAREVKGFIARERIKKNERTAINRFCEKIIM